MWREVGLISDWSEVLGLEYCESFDWVVKDEGGVDEVGCG